MNQQGITPKNFAFTAAAFEGSLVAVAIGLGWLLNQPPLRTFRFDPYDVLWGVAATLPPLVLFWLCLKLPLKPFKNILQILDDMLLPMFRDCGLVQLAILAGLAGLGEEMLFRGIIQAAATVWIGGPYGAWLGLTIAALLFGILHIVTPTYALLAGLIGLYLGGLWVVNGNLLTPIVVHALYDFIALTYLIKTRS